MAPQQFCVASVSLQLSAAKPDQGQGPLRFNWQRAPSAQLFAFISAPLSAQVAESGSGSGPGDSPWAGSGARGSGSKARDEHQWGGRSASSRGEGASASGVINSGVNAGAASDQHASASAPGAADAPRARFPPWKQLGIAPPKLPGASANRHVLAEQGTVDDSGGIVVESCPGRRRRVYMPRNHNGPLPPAPPAAAAGAGGAAAAGKGGAAATAAAAAAATAAAVAEWEGFEIVDERQTHEDHLRSLVHSYLLPNGFPDSVAPQYAPYMAWRGVQYFFGGAISVFTTQSLLGALGVAGRFSGEAAAAINWVIKDGAGRLGRLLFARWGRELDCELKQFRLMGDLLMEAGAALELATIYAPPAFLPLACTANLSKNLAAVAASSTRAPIYRTFALQNNLADITAKGESVANLADILGTVAGIGLSRLRLPRMATFAVLSAGYLVSSRKEVDAVELPYMNRARLAYAARQYLTGGQVPGVAEANHNEPLLPWGRYNQGRLVLGASVEAACARPGDLLTAAAAFRDGRYLVTYRPDTKKAYVLLRDGATNMDCLQASFFGHVFLHVLDGNHLDADGLPLPAGFRGGLADAPSPSQLADFASVTVVCGGSSNRSCGAASTSSSSRAGGAGRTQGGAGAPAGPGAAAAAAGAAGASADERWRAALLRTQAVVSALYPDFLAQAERNGWKLQQTMLNPKEHRLLKLSVPLQPL
ncbi:hypothetical protein HXX76_009956 [Chlamydomonas incerta]|uniref:Uncharacterized protein n=1 Tax=Chlamydomonas incerta TaxID=51695 RepID=A0A835SNJ3_CHLIN|nr:hypothetical protein HXX76_009956 [Chlamydomonas incerta]|eukprot:KAG2430432.1 hypothetical protein HXX76_009956 [Chlamydomonas incerta]